MLQNSKEWTLGSTFLTSEKPPSLNVPFLTLGFSWDQHHQARMRRQQQWQTANPRVQTRTLRPLLFFQIEPFTKCLSKLKAVLFLAMFLPQCLDRKKTLCKVITGQFNWLLTYYPTPHSIQGCLAAAAAKSLQSCPTLCDPIDGSPPGSPVPGILQARTLEWVAISFSTAWKWKVKGKSLSRVRLLATPWTAARQVPLSIEYSRQEYWSGVPLPSLSRLL